MNFKAHFEQAWQLSLQYIVPLVLMTLVLAVVSALTFGILAPVSLAGYFSSVLRMVRQDREPQVQDLFSEMRLFWPLFGFALLFFLAAAIGFMLLVLPGMIVVFGGAFVCLYLLFLLTDRRLRLVEGIKKSYELTVKGSISDQIVVFLIFMGLSALGSTLFIAWLFTQPLATAFLALAYEETGKGEPS